MREAFEAASQVEDERMGLILLEIGNEEIQQEGFPCAGSPEDHGVRHVAVMEIQEVGRMVVGLQDGQILLPEMTVARLATVKGEEKREIRIVRIEQIQGTQVVGVVAGNRREKRIQ